MHRFLCGRVKYCPLYNIDNIVGHNNPKGLLPRDRNTHYAAVIMILVYTLRACVGACMRACVLACMHVFVCIGVMVADSAVHYSKL